MSNGNKIFLYDTTLRDGTQAEEVNFTVNDKIRITKKLIDFGISCVEGGFPGSNPRDMDYFNALKTANIPKDKVSAFSSTRRAKTTCEADSTIQELLKSEAGVFTVFGKTWDFHVTDALKISYEENLELIADTIRYLKKYADKVFFDAEHFFDGYKANREYAIKAIKAAVDGGADCVVLCETNGGVVTHEVSDICRDVKAVLGDFPFGVHCHNDCDMAVAKIGRAHV